MLWIVLWFAASLIVALLWGIMRWSVDRDRLAWPPAEPLHQGKQGSNHRPAM